jgi:hypothetical protein
MAATSPTGLLAKLASPGHPWHRREKSESFGPVGKPFQGRSMGLAATLTPNTGRRPPIDGTPAAGARGAASVRTPSGE